jgi:hypothetical protein
MTLRRANFGWLLAAALLAGCGDEAAAGQAEDRDAAAPAGRGPARAHDAGRDAEVQDAGAELEDAGEGDAAVVDAGQLRLLARSPEPDADNVWARAPIVLQFSAALDPASVTEAAIRIETEAGPIAFDLQLSADAREVRLVPGALPQEPARVTAIVSDALVDEGGRAFAGERWSWTLPLWHRSGEVETVLDGAVDATVALDEQDRPLIAWVAGGEGASVLRVARVQEDGFELLAEAPLAAAAQSGPGHAAWIDGGGDVFVASIEQETTVVVRRLAGDAGWEDAFPPWTAQGGVESIASVDLALAGDAALLAVVEVVGAERDARVLRHDGGVAGWVALGPALDRVPSQAASRAVVAAASPTAISAAWLEHDGVSENLYVARYLPDEQAWAPLGAALDLELDARVEQPQLAVAADGAEVVLWNEGTVPRSAAYVARWTGRFQVLGGALDPARVALGSALALDARGEPIAVLVAGTAAAGQLAVRRHNGSPAPPFGLAARPQASCAIPDEADPAFPVTLSATGCFADVPSRTPAPGLLPYTLGSPLWSDGALKRRFVVIPDGQTIGYAERDTWALPVGTVLVKEFSLARSAGDGSGGIAPALRGGAMSIDAVPLETRFLVKRCEPGACRAAWEGYSYEWNDAGTEAVLLENLTASSFKDWTVDGRLHRHSYPGREECTRCHATAAGGALGLSTGQLNRSHDYGEHVDNQLRALAHIGLFGASFAEPDEDAITAALRLPSPYDPAEPLAARVRSYAHANCSHCHRPDGRWPVVDLRFDAELRAAADPSPNICDKLVPGDASASLLYLKVSARQPDLPPAFQGEPMPPLATLIADARQLPAFAAWIDGMTTCP